ncbi:hypothetical protein ACQKM2_14315 [Streptomyces sp. NPDC004126]|uniref:hypothetical protein n=1 Tax=Streptomyces sp. NPDC004126 TaxID=3390695 RepID=UPI003D08C3F8
MIRHRHLTLLAVPLLLSPAAAALASPASAAPLPAASCELVATGEAGSGPYTLVLEGFDPNQSVTINGPNTSQRTRVGDDGTLDKQGVRYGQYSVTAKGKRTGCLTPPREKHDGGKQGNVRVTTVVISPVTKQGTPVDCTQKSIRVAFDGRITATGKGDVSYYWTLISGSQRIGGGKVTFPGGTTTQPVPVVADFYSVGGQPPTGYVTLHIPSADIAVKSPELTLSCVKP